MNNKKRLTAPLVIVGFALSLSACSFGGDKEPAAQVIVEDTPAPKAAENVTPTPTPTVVPDAQSTTYNSSDKQVSIELPDATWSNKTDDPKMQRFESPEQGKILIVYGDAEDLSTAIMPDNEDLANTILMGEGFQQVEDFEILTYENNYNAGVNVISYLVHYTNPQRSDGRYYTVNRYFKNDNEYYRITADVYKDDPNLLLAIQMSVDSFRILGESGLKAATDVPAAPAEEQAPPAEEQAPPAEPAPAGTDSSSNYTEEQLADTNQTRTIYPDEGASVVITPLEDGTWTDLSGNIYRFTSEQDVYDQNDAYYYYHGEPGNVRFMTPEAE